MTIDPKRWPELDAVGCVLEVFVERPRPRCLLRHGVDLHGPNEIAHRGQQLTGHFGDGSIRGESNTVCQTITVLGHGVMRMEIERHDEGTRAVGCWERLGFPTAGAEP